MRLKTLLLFGWLAALGAGCTRIDRVIYPKDSPIFLRSGELQDPYKSLGLLQITRKGVILFGFFDPADINLDAALSDLKLGARLMGGDGVINLRWHQAQYPTAVRVLFAILFFVPLPGDVTVSGEVVRIGKGVSAVNTMMPSGRM